MKNQTIATTVAALILFASTAVGALAMDLNKFTEQVLNRAVQIDENCSGHVIKSEPNEKGEIQTLILTAKHCVNKDHNVRLPVYDNDSRATGYILYKAKVYWSFPSDIAVLELLDKATRFNPVRIASGDYTPALGTQVWTVGYPLGLALTVTDGRFAAREDLPGYGEFFRATPGTAPGNSGGGLFVYNDKSGWYELIGVTSMHYRAHDHVAFYVPVDQIRQQTGSLIPTPGVKPTKRNCLWCDMERP